MRSDALFRIRGSSIVGLTACGRESSGWSWRALDVPAGMQPLPTRVSSVVMRVLHGDEGEGHATHFTPISYSVSLIIGIAIWHDFVSPEFCHQNWCMLAITIRFTPGCSGHSSSAGEDAPDAPALLAQPTAGLLQGFELLPERRVVLAELAAVAPFV